MGNVLEFSFVYSKDATKIKIFLDNIPRNIDCINYIDIYNKLSKNDYLQCEPSDAVISSYLIKNLQSTLGTNTVHSIFYVLSNIDDITIHSIQDYIKSLTEKEIYYKLYHTPDINISNITYLMNEIIEFEVSIS